jgi:hypothetical protein
MNFKKRERGQRRDKKERKARAVFILFVDSPLLDSR